MKKKLIALFVLTSLAISSASNAGFAGGPYFLWVNLSTNENIEQVIEKKLSEGEICSRPDMQIFPVPNWISRDLINQAIVQGDKKSIAALDVLIRRKYPGYSEKGLDGIIVYNETPKPQLSNFVRGRKQVTKVPLGKLKDEEAAWRIFCGLIPPITRPN